jgi:hypothetical protein
VAGRDDLEVTAVQSGDLVQVEPLGKRYHAGINCLEPQGYICGEQFSHPPVVMRGHLDDPELVIGDGGAEFGSQSGAPTPLGIGSR